MIVVADATCLIALCRIERLDILRRLFGKVNICETVYDEVVIAGKDRPGTKEVREAKWIERKWVKDKIAVRLLEKDLDKGEAETIILASETNANYVILDDKESSQIAKLLGLNVIGTIGLLLLADRLGIITDFKDMMKRLRKAGFRIKDELYDKILKEIEV